jgi:putative transposase
MGKTIYVNGETYHIYNRGINKQPVFRNKRDFERAIITLNYYKHADLKIKLSRALQLNQQDRTDYFNSINNSRQIVDIYTYCLMPNHIHFELRQLEDNGIPRFIGNFSNSITRYSNVRYNSDGPIFKGSYKGLHIEDDDQFIHLHRYIHINPAVANIVKEEDLDQYPWSSLPEYLGKTQIEICKKEDILNNFRDINAYRKFIHDQIDYGKKLKKIAHLTFEHSY